MFIVVDKLFSTSINIADKLLTKSLSAGIFEMAFNLSMSSEGLWYPIHRARTLDGWGTRDPSGAKARIFLCSFRHGSITPRDTNHRVGTPLKPCPFKAKAGPSLRLSTPASKNRSPGTPVKNGYGQDDTRWWGSGGECYPTHDAKARHGCGTRHPAPGDETTPRTGHRFLSKGKILKKRLDRELVL